MAAVDVVTPAQLKRLLDSLPGICCEANCYDADRSNDDDMQEAVRPNPQAEDHGKTGFKEAVDLMKGFPLHLD